MAFSSYSNYPNVYWDTTYTKWTSYPPGYAHRQYTNFYLKGDSLVMTVPHILNSGSVIFIAKGQTWSVGMDNPNFELLCRLIGEGVMDEDKLVSLTSTKQLVIEVGKDRLKVENGTLILDGKVLSSAWYRVLFLKPEMAYILLIRKGDNVRIEGDEDAPDGTYVVSDTDDSDPDQRVYIEADTFFGFPKTSSIKEIINAPS